MPKLRKRRLRRGVSKPPVLSVETCGASMIDAMTSPTGSDDYFADRLKDLRQRIVGKQACLSYAVGCTDAAVSFWESGKRIPHQGMIARILVALAQGGASDGVLSSLLRTWQQAKLGRTARAVQRVHRVY